MKISEITLIGQYIKDLSFENPMAPNLPSQNKNPMVNLDVNTTYLDLKNNNHDLYWFFINIQTDYFILRLMLTAGIAPAHILYII